MKVKILAQYHPAASLHQPRLWSTMLADWEFMPKSVPSDFTFVEHKGGYPPIVALDTENDRAGELGIWGVAYRDEKGKIVVESYEGTKVKRLFPDSTVLFHHAKWDLRVLARNKMPTPKKYLDTMVAAYCLGLGRQDVTMDSSKGDVGMVGGLGLKYLARRHLGMSMDTWTEMKDKGADELRVYNAKDAVATLLLYEAWKDKLPQHFYDIDMPLLPVLMAMEDRGIMLDPKRLGKYNEYLRKEIESIELPFNPQSPKQLGEYIYGYLKIEPWKFTATGQPSTDASVLETIDNPVIQKVLRIKSLMKEHGTYTSSYLKKMTLKGRIHPEFKQVRTATGRLASANPNLQNVPREGPMRGLFIAPKGKKLIRLDYFQLEFYTMAAITQDERMMEAALSRRNIHAETAKSTGLSYDDAKTLNYLMLFGGTPWKISKQFHVSIETAKQYRIDYFEKYPGILKYMEEKREQALSEKVAVNWFGRVRRLDAMYVDDWRVREEGIREAYNTPVQGTAAEIVKRAMIDLHEKHSAPLLLQVHDELIFEVDTRKAKAYAAWLKEYVPTITIINGVTFPVSVGIGSTWAEAKKEEK